MEYDSFVGEVSVVIITLGMNLLLLLIINLNDGLVTYY